MKKTFLVLTVVLLAALLPFTSCSGPDPGGIGDIQSDSSSVTVPKEEAPVKEPVINNAIPDIRNLPDTRTEQESYDLYRAVFENEPAGDIDIFWYGMEDYGLYWVFGFYDIDGNGTDELLIGMAALESDYVPGIYIKQIWTYANGSDILLIEDWGAGESAGLYIANDGMIGTGQFSGDERYGFFKIKEGQYVERVATLYAGQPYDPKTYSSSGDVEFYYVEGPVPNMVWGDGKKMAEQDYYALLNKYGDDKNAQYLTNWYYMPDRQDGMSPWNITLEVSASSVRSPMGDIKYGPELTRDNNKNTAWCEGVNGPGIGEWIEFTAPSQRMIKGFSVANGYYKYAYDEKISGYKSLYYSNNAIKELSVTTGGFTRSYLLPWSDYGRYWTVYFKDEFLADSIRFTIKDVYYGSKSGRAGADDNDTLISEVEIF